MNLDSPTGTQSHEEIPYAPVFPAIAALSAISIALSYVSFGSSPMALACGIAAVQVYLALTYCMHLKYEHKVLWWIAVLPLALAFFMGIMIGIDLSYGQDH